jgi:hypothetical protein
VELGSKLARLSVACEGNILTFALIAEFHVRVLHHNVEPVLFRFTIIEIAHREREGPCIPPLKIVGFTSPLVLSLYLKAPSKAARALSGKGLASVLLPGETPNDLKGHGSVN